MVTKIIATPNTTDQKELEDLEAKLRLLENHMHLEGHEKVHMDVNYSPDVIDLTPHKPIAIIRPLHTYSKGKDGKEITLEQQYAGDYVQITLINNLDKTVYRIHFKEPEK